MKRSLPRPIVWLIRLAVPAPRADEILSDLVDEYSGSLPRPGRWWLARETGSILWAYSLKPLSRAQDVAPVWIRDFRLTLRGLRRAPVPMVATAAILSTGLLALFLSLGLAQTLLARQVSSVHGHALRRIGFVDQRDRLSLRLSFPEIETIQDHLRDVAEVTSVNMQPAVLRVRGVDVQTLVEVVDGKYFGLTGMQAVAGRGLISTDDQAAAPPAVVVTNSFAQRHLGGLRDVVGESIGLNGHKFTIVGVAGVVGSSNFLGASVDAWIATAHADVVLNRGWRTNVENRWFSAFALPTNQKDRDRVPPEVETSLAAASDVLAQRYPEAWRRRRLQSSAATVITGSQRDTATLLIAVLGGLAVLILVTAASNVAGVLLARAAVSQRQVAIHLAIGSGRAAIVRRQLMEGALLGICSAVLAMGLYAWSRRALMEVTLLPTLALRFDLPFDARLVLEMLLLGTGAGVALAGGPALWAAKVDLIQAMRDAGMSASGHHRAGHLRRGLVSAQVCLSLVLVVGAALFTRSLSALNEVDLGFLGERLVAMDFDLEPSAAPIDELPALARDALARTEATPGVLSAAMSNRAPVDQSTPTMRVRVPWDAEAEIPDVTFYLATARYFETVGLRVIAGRPFSATEAESTAPVVTVNETLARQLRADGDVLDRSLLLGDEATPVRIIGVVHNSKYRSLSESTRPHVYRPTPATLGLTLLVRTNSEPRATLLALQRTLDDVGPGLVGFFPRTFDDHVAIEYLPTRATAAAASALGAVALSLSAVGLYGLVSWFVTLRRREIGVRMALGASSRDVLRLVGLEALSTVVPGLVVGLLMCGGLAALAQGALFGVGPLDYVAFLSGLASIAAVVAIASYVPVRRAIRVDPSAALRMQ